VRGCVGVVRSSDQEPIVVACAADGRYVMPLAVMLTSLVDRLEPARELCVYVLDAGIPAGDRSRLCASLAAPNVRLRWISSRSSSLPELPIWGRLSPVEYQRLLIAELLPRGLQRTVWLDCDLVVQQDLSRLWDTELGDRHVLAAQDMVIPYVSSFMGISHHAQLGIPASAKYFNAGVMLVNLALWREHDIPGQVIEYVQRYRDDVMFLEQEGLNAVLAGKWGELDPRWNQNASVSGRRFYKPRHLDERTYDRVVEDPWIVHFNGNIKPWTVRRQDRLRVEYFRYLDATPWAGWRPTRTFTGVLVGMYESSRLRNVLYPVESRGLDVLRRLTRRGSWCAAR
jgi:lipopolysaccharide biosynthesis glycosyltransferase